MHNRIRLGLSAWTMMVGLAGPLAAQDWAIDKQHSSLAIVHPGPTPLVLGTVQQWDGKVVFDPNHLDLSHVTINVDVGSIRTADPRWNAILPQPEWLSVKDYPVATFESDAITHVSGDAYQAAGALIIRGKRQNVTLPFKLVVNDNVAHAQGVISLIRTDFGIGGPMDNGSDMAIILGVSFDLTVLK